MGENLGKSVISVRMVGLNFLKLVRKEVWESCITLRDVHCSSPQPLAGKEEVKER